MKIILYILLLFALAACNRNGIASTKRKLASQYWVSKNLDFYTLDSSIESGHTIYGSAYLLDLDTNKIVNSLSADFYWKDDSLYLGGEPGMTIKTGKWFIEDTTLILSQRLIYKMIMFGSDSIGQVKRDTVHMADDSILLYRSDTLVPLQTPSLELKTFINRNWDQLGKG